MKQLLQARFYVLVVIFGAVVVLGLRVGALVESFQDGTAFRAVTVAVAEDAPPTKDDAKPADVAPPTLAPVTPAPVDGVAPAEPAAGKPAATEPPSEDLRDLSAGEMEVLKQLASRRAQLDTREQELGERHALLQAAEQRVDQKISELTALRTQLQGMLGQLDEQQQAQLDNLVKIYEAMKPKDAARIFMAMDMPVLLQVMRQMKPARSAPILAEMEPEKAKEVTMALSRQNELPDKKLVLPE